MDVSPDPLVIDGRSWAIERVSANTAAVVSSTVSAPATNYNYQLVYDPTTGSYYTSQGNTAICRIDGTTFGHTVLPNGIGAFFNFLSLGIDTTGNLWLASDTNGGQLWSIDKTTGVGTLRAAIKIPVGYQITALAIDDRNDFTVFAKGSLAGQGAFFGVNPSTGDATLLQSTQFSDIDLVNAMTYDPVGRDFYGILEDRSVNPRSYTLVRITGVPEPKTVTVSLLVLATLSGRRRRPLFSTSHRGHGVV